MRDTRWTWFWTAGCAAPLLYLATVVAGGWFTPGYGHLHQPVSALFEAGAPHALPVSLAFVAYNLLLVAFGAGLALRERPWPLRLAAAMILVNGLAGLAIELTPMDPIGAPATVAGAAHLVLAGLLVLTCMAAMAAAAFGWWRQSRRAAVLVSVLLLAVMLVAGALAAMAAAAGWPLLGLYQRLTIAAYLVWVFGLALNLLRVPAG